MTNIAQQIWLKIVGVDKSIKYSALAHVVLLGAALLFSVSICSVLQMLPFNLGTLPVFGATCFKSAIAPEFVPFDVMTPDQLARVMAGMKTGKNDNPKPLVEKVAEAKPADEAVGKIAEKAPVITETAPPPQPKVEEKPVEKKPDPPKPVAEAKPKEEPKPVEKKPDPKVDPIAEAIKKEEKKPPPKPVQAAKPPETAKPKIVERHFDQTQIAALLDKRDPSRQAVTGATLNSNAALGTAQGKAANNSATWGAMFLQQVRGCWKKPHGGIDTKDFFMEVQIKLKQDGSLAVAPIPLSSPKDSFQRVFLESALRATIECAPYRLPPAFFEEWKDFIPQFKTEERG